eukprot:scaffold322122_cov19-Prasinocladus_malaysianus.AAC.1
MKADWHVYGSKLCNMIGDMKSSSVSCLTTSVPQLLEAIICNMSISLPSIGHCHNVQTVGSWHVRPCT